MTVRVVTDSTAHLPPDLVQELDIVVVPFHVEVDGQAYLDGVDLDEDTFHRLAYQEELASLCQSRSGRFLSVSTESTLEGTLFDTLRRAGWVSQ